MWVAPAHEGLGPWGARLATSPDDDSAWSLAGCARACAHPPAFRRPPGAASGAGRCDARRRCLVVGAHCDRACQASTRNAARMRTYCAKRHSKRERAGRAEPRVSPHPYPLSQLPAPGSQRATRNGRALLYVCRVHCTVPGYVQRCRYHRVRRRAFRPGAVGWRAVMKLKPQRSCLRSRGAPFALALAFEDPADQPGG